jgi:hypothetical protein
MVIIDKVVDKIIEIFVMRYLLVETLNPKVHYH